MMKKNKSWFRPKGYEHFTPRLTKKDSRFVSSYVKSEEEIAKHAFMPLVHAVIKERKYKYDAERKKYSHRKLKEGRLIGTAKRRQIFYPAHLDAQIYSYYAHKIIGPRYNDILDQDPVLRDSIIAYRKLKTSGGESKNNIHFAHELFDFIRDQEECVVLTFDIKNFFDSLDHKTLKKAWCYILSSKSLPKAHFNIYKSLVNFSFIDLNDVMEIKGISHYNELRRRESNAFSNGIKEFKDDFVSKGVIQKNPFKNSRGKPTGIPQGTPISALLANLYLYQFDYALVDKLRRARFSFYRRYSDDLAIVCHPNEAEEIHDFIVEQIETTCKLKMHEEKTKLFRFQSKGSIRTVEQIQLDGKKIGDRPLEYLGFSFDGKVISLKSKSLAKYYRKMKRATQVRAWRTSIAIFKSKEFPKTDTLFWKKKLFLNYSHLGKNRRNGNYLTYADRAARVMKEPRIKHQVSRSWSVLTSSIEKHKVKHGLPLT